MNLTVRKAVVLAVVLGMLIPTLILGVYLARITYTDKLVSEVDRTLKHEADVIALGVRESLWALDNDSASALVEAVMKDSSLVSVEILDPHLGRFVFKDFPERRNGKIHLLERPVLHRGETIGKIRIELSENPLKSALLNQIFSFAGLLVFQLLVSVILILYVLQQRVGRPLIKLGEEAKSLANGELDKPIFPSRKDEIGDVETQLELTRQALQGLFHTLEQKNRALEVDLRERMRVEAALRDREQRLRTLVEQSPLAVIEFDLGWHILDWNDAAIRIFGWRREEVLGRHVSILLDQSGSVQQNEVLNQQLGRSLSATHTKLQCTRSDKAHITCQWYNSMIRDSVGAEQRIVSMVEDITERQRSEDEIKRLATVVRLTNNLIALTDAEGRIEWVNQAFALRCSLPEAESSGKLLTDILQGNDATESAPQISSIVSAIDNGRHLTGLDLPLKNPDGDVFWVSLELQPIRDEQGNTFQWVALLTDINERRNTTEALRAIARIGGELDSDQFLSQLLGIVARACGAQLAYIAHHHDERLEILASYCTPGWSLSIDTAQHSTFLANYAARTGPLILNSNAYEALANDTLCGSNTLAQALILEPIRDNHQRVTGHLTLLFEAPLQSTEAPQSLAALGAARASTEFQRLLALEALRHSEQKFSSIFIYSPIPIALIRRHGKQFMDVNPSFIENFGYAREDLIGQALEQTQLGSEQSTDEWRLELLKSEKEGIGASVRLQTRSGELRDCQIHVSQVTMDEESCLLLAVVDISSLLNARRQIEELNLSLEKRVADRTIDLASANAELEKTLERLKHTLDELVRSEKLAALGSLVAGIAHELNTPIGNSLMVASTLRDVNHGFREQMKTGLRKSVLESFIKETDSASDILLRNLHRAAELISSFKQVAVDQTSSQRRKFQLCEVVNEIVLTMQPIFRRTSHHIECDIPPELQMDSFPGPLGQVIANLLNNAILHAFEGREGGLVSLRATADGSEHILFSCQDNGNGITPANLRRIFDPFFTTRLGRDGTGLGLNIVHNIVTGILGGEIGVDSQSGLGTTFSIRLPRIAPENNVCILDNPQNAA